MRVPNKNAFSQKHLRITTFSLVALSLILPVIPGSATPKSCALPIPLPVSATSQETCDKADLITAINHARTLRGLGLLAEDPILSKAACAHSKEMAVRDYFDHHSPTPGLATPMDRYLACLHEAGGAIPDTLRIGENIYYCSLFNHIYTVDYGHRALMASPEHRANLLDPHFTQVGLGLFHDSHGGFWMTEMFLGNPKGAH
jgi:uncharacterized protein YkwD